MSFFDFLLDPANWSGPGGVWARLGEHLVYSVSAVALAALVAVPLGILVGHTRRGDALVAGVSNSARAIPTLGLLVLVVTALGADLFPIVLALAVLAVPPILINTAAGFRAADAGAVHAGRALGMTAGQLIRSVELPLALPLMISGVRSASLQVIATATVAALAAGGGLGRFVVDGQAAGRGGYPQMFAGAVLVALLAIVVDLVLGGVGYLLRRRSTGVRRADRGTGPAGGNGSASGAAGGAVDDAGVRTGVSGPPVEQRGDVGQPAGVEDTGPTRS